MNKIAIIEDDIDICNMIAKFLENNKYIVHYALNGAEGIELCKSLVPDLIILDIMLPKLNGNDVLQRLRKFTNAPVIVVSAKTMVQTKIDLLKLGADDYMTKPFDLHELLARIEANLKRTSNTSCQNDTLTYRDIEINNSLVYIKEVLVSFTSTELKILRLLLQYPQKIFSKQNLYESIWNESKRSIVSILTKKYLIASRQVLVCDNDLAVFLTKAIDLPENSDPCHPYDLGFLTANIQNNRMV